jgi:Omp85 superfamily domain
MQKAQNAKEMITPRIEVGFSKPTFFGHRAPFGITYSSDTQRYDTTLGFSKKLSELELSVSHPSNRHSLSYSFSTRDILPLPHPTSDYQTASAPHVVASANTSTKSSLRYSYAINNLNVHPANNVVVPSGGYRLNTDLEVAGPGGEAHFVKGEAHLATGFSLWRYQPDTGYQKPLPSAEFLEREATLASGGAAAEVLKSREEQDNAAMGNLKPFPGTKIFCPTMMFGLKKKNPHTSTSTLPTLRHRAKPYTFGERMAGWLSPGFTFLFDASLGVMRGYGPDAGASFSSSSAGVAGKPKAGDASPAPLASSASSSSSAGLPRLADRFFVTSARMRGFEAIGPIAPRVKPHGSPFGDAIGGDCYGVLTARLLMPPPIPSVRIANAGLRTQLWATAGKVGSVDSMMGHFNQDVLTDPAKLAKRVFAGSKTWSASAGIGIVSD